MVRRRGKGKVGKMKRKDGSIREEFRAQEFGSKQETNMEGDCVEGVEFTKKMV